MIAYRSGDNGKSWKGPTIAFDIDYSQHGLIPLIPSGSKIYAFGTQPIPSEYSREKDGTKTPRSATVGRTTTATRGARSR